MSHFLFPDFINQALGGEADELETAFPENVRCMVDEAFVAFREPGCVKILIEACILDECEVVLVECVKGVVPHEMFFLFVVETPLQKFPLDEAGALGNQFVVGEEYGLFGVEKRFGLDFRFGEFFAQADFELDCGAVEFRLFGSFEKVQEEYA